MGVDGPFLPSLVDMTTSVKLQNLPRMGEMATCALDVSIMLHEVAGVVDPVATLDGNWVPFMDECLRRLYKLVKLRMLVVVVFDGAPNPFKRLEDDRRGARRVAALEECTELRARLAEAGRLPMEEKQLLQSQLRKAARAAFHRS